MMLVLNLKMNLTKNSILEYEKIIHDKKVIVLPQYPYLIFFSRGGYYLGSQDVSKEKVQTSQNETSRLPETGSAGFPKGEASYKNHNQTDLSYTDPSIHPPDDSEIEESVREQIDYPLLAQSYPYDDPDCLLELICEVLTSNAPTIRIGSENIPTPKVQDRFRKLTFEHVAYVMDALRETTTKIWNIRAYLLTALYNAPITIGPYYAAAVRHDYG